MVVPEGGDTRLTVVGNTFAYGARAGRAYIAGRGGNRFGICLRKSHEGEGPRIVVEGVEANAFQYMTGGIALVLGPVGFNLGAGLTGGRVYLLDLDGSRLNRQYVKAEPLDAEGAAEVEQLLREHAAETASRLGRGACCAPSTPGASRASRPRSLRSRSNNLHLPGAPPACLAWKPGCRPRCGARPRGRHCGALLNTRAGTAVEGCGSTPGANPPRCALTW